MNPVRGKGSRSTYPISERSARVITDSVFSTHSCLIKVVEETDLLVTHHLKQQEQLRLVTRADQLYTSKRNGKVGVDSNLRRARTHTPDLQKTIRMMDRFIGREEERKAARNEQFSRIPKPSARPYSQVLQGRHSNIGSWTSKCIARLDGLGSETPQPGRVHQRRGLGHTMPIGRATVPLPVLHQPVMPQKGFNHETWKQINTYTSSTFIASKRGLARRELEVEFEKLAKKTDWPVRRIAQLHMVYTIVTGKQMEVALEGLTKAFGIVPELLHQIVTVMSTSANGVMSYAQFIWRLKAYITGSKKQQAKLIFAIVDVSGDEIVSKIELLRFFVGGVEGSKDQKQLCSDTVNEIMRCVDEDGSGDLSISEFLRKITAEANIEVWWLFKTISPITKMIEAMSLVEKSRPNTRASNARKDCQAVLRQVNPKELWDSLKRVVNKE